MPLLQESSDTPAPPAPEPTECPMPDWANDEYCDDDNNIAACNYDGGACCTNDNSASTMFCTECLCKSASG